MNGNLVKIPKTKIRTASNVLNIIASALACAIFAFFIIMHINQRPLFDEHSALSVFCSIIPLLLAITLKFVFGIINGRNILQFKIVQNGLLFLILNIIFIVFGITLFVIFDFFHIEFKKTSQKCESFNKYFVMIISFLCLIVIIFAIIERIRKKNDIHLFFLITYTIVIAISCFISILFLISLNNKLEEIEEFVVEELGGVN